MQKARPMESIQGFMNAFKQFEMKLDKLQEDVNYHGNTLSELRVMVANLVAVSADMKLEEARPGKRTAAIQYDERYKVEDTKVRRRNTIHQPLPNKMKAKSFQDQKYGLRMSVEPPFHMGQRSSPAVGKHARPMKAEAPRKTTMLKPQKTIEMKQNKALKSDNKNKI